MGLKGQRRVGNDGMGMRKWKTHSVMFPPMSIMVPLRRSGNERAIGEKLESFNCSVAARCGRKRLCSVRP